MDKYKKIMNNETIQSGRTEWLKCLNKLFRKDHSFLFNPFGDLMFSLFIPNSSLSRIW